MHYLILLLALAQAPKVDLRPELPKTAGSAAVDGASRGASATASHQPSAARQDTAAADAAAPGAPAASGAAPSTPATEAPAVESGANQPKTWYEELLTSGALGLMIEGGIFMWPILFLGIAALAVIIERFRSLRMLGTDTSKLRGDVLELLQQDRLEEALERCNAEQGPVPAVLSAGLRKFLMLRKLNYDPSRIEEQVVKAMDDYGVHIVAALEKHLPILATVASAAPMLGFLGTVQGMVVAFAEIEAKLGTVNIVKLAAGGIKVALLTTCLGLIVGIPAYVAFNYFNSVINRFVLDVEETAAELIEVVTTQMALAGEEKEESLEVQN